MSDALVDDLLRRLADLPEEQMKEVDKFIEDQSEGHLWIPSPGPQLDAVAQLADGAQLVLQGADAGIVGIVPEADGVL